MEARFYMQHVAQEPQLALHHIARFEWTCLDNATPVSLLAKFVSKMAESRATAIVRRSSAIGTAVAQQSKFRDCFGDWEPSQL